MKTYKTYEEYLSLGEVLGASDFLADDPDQLCFAISHQVTELWFKLLITELTRFEASGELRHLLRADAVIRQTNGIWEVFESIRVADFLRFREELNGISGAGSAQYYRLQELVVRCRGRCLDQQAIALLSKIDSALAQWKFAHIQITRKFLGDAPGTGGTSGASYLRDKGADPLVTHDDLKKF